MKSQNPYFEETNEMYKKKPPTPQEAAQILADIHGAEVTLKQNSQGVWCATYPYMYQDSPSTAYFTIRGKIAFTLDSEKVFTAQPRDGEYITTITDKEILSHCTEKGCIHNNGSGCVRELIRWKAIANHCVDAKIESEAGK